jgi:hypothetical protein
VKPSKGRGRGGRNQGKKGDKKEGEGDLVMNESLFDWVRVQYSHEMRKYSVDQEKIKKGVEQRIYYHG